MGFQFLGPRSTVLSPSDPRPPTVTCASELVRMHKPGGPRVLLLRGFSTGATPMIDVQAHAATGICYGLVLSLQGCISGELNALPLAAEWQA